MIAIGLEGSANKIGVGVILHPAKGKGSPQILANIRHTYVSPPGEGFLPKDTAIHHRSHVTSLVKRSIEEAGIKIADVDVSSYVPLLGSGCLYLQWSPFMESSCFFFPASHSQSPAPARNSAVRTSRSTPTHGPAYHSFPAIRSPPASFPSSSFIYPL